jgi:hypothetical protein
MIKEILVAAKAAGAESLRVGMICQLSRMRRTEDLCTGIDREGSDEAAGIACSWPRSDRRRER